MSEQSITPEGQHRRKRVRKGTRSCWECKRRKIKCVYQSADHSVCTGCLDKGTHCRSQEYVDDASPREGTSAALGQRMGRVEMMLEKLMEKVTEVTEPERSNYCGDILTPSSTSATQYDQAPFMSMLDDVSRQSNGSIRNVQGDISRVEDCEMRPPASKNGTPGVYSTVCSSAASHSEKLRRKLTAMLPSQHDLDFLSDQSQGWWLIRRHILPHLVKYPDHDLSNPFNIETVSAGPLLPIARLLLCVALCIQQLPPKLDTRKLQTAVPLCEMMGEIVSVVASMVTSDDEMIGSLEGVECLILQGIYQINAGNLRRAWLLYRRAMNVAQLMGLHRRPSKTARSEQGSTETRRQYMWLQIVKGDRYLSLILGVPSPTTDTTLFPFDDHASWLTVEDRYTMKLSEVAGHILSRNQGDCTHAFSSTQGIDEKLDNLSKTMPRSWWQVPSEVQNERFDELATVFGRMLCHIWHFELETLLHLPFMIRAATDRRYEYSRVSCLAACRGLIKRWMFIKESNSASFECKIIEFQAFTAAVTLLLGVLGQNPANCDPLLQQEKEKDLAIVETVVTILEEIKQDRVNIIKQSSHVIRTLQAILRNDVGQSGNLRLSIPHFGTISVSRGGTVQSIDGDRILGAAPREDGGVVDRPLGVNLKEPGISWNPMGVQGNGYNMNGGNGTINENGSALMQTPAAPILQFSSSHFPTIDTGPQLDAAMEWPFQESDILFFDSLLNTDVEGNWDF